MNESDYCPKKQTEYFVIYEDTVFRESHIVLFYRSSPEKMYHVKLPRAYRQSNVSSIFSSDKHLVPQE